MIRKMEWSRGGTLIVAEQEPIAPRQWAVSLTPGGPCTSIARAHLARRLDSSGEGWGVLLVGVGNRPRLVGWIVPPEWERVGEGVIRLGSRDEALAEYNRSHPAEGGAS